MADLSGARKGSNYFGSFFNKKLLQKNKKLIDRVEGLCYSKECYIMARYACLSEMINRIMQ